MHHVNDSIGRAESLVAKGRLAIQKITFPRHEDVVENDYRVLLLEARSERRIESGLAVIVGVTADQSQSGSCDGQCECKGERDIVFRCLQDRGRETLRFRRPTARVSPTVARR